MSPLVVDTWLQNLQDPDVNEMIRGKYIQYSQPLIHLIEEGVANGEFKPVDAPALASIFIAMIDGLMVQILVDPTVVDLNGTSRALKTLVAGLLV